MIEVYMVNHTMHGRPKQFSSLNPIAHFQIRPIFIFRLQCIRGRGLRARSRVETIGIKGFQDAKKKKVSLIECNGVSCLRISFSPENQIQSNV